MKSLTRFTVGRTAAVPEGLVIWTDPGLDDTIHHHIVAAAARDGLLNVLAVVAHFGCSALENTVEHAVRSFGWAIDVPVFVGSARPAVYPHPVCGEALSTYYIPNGLCGKRLPDTALTARSDKPAEDAVAEIVASYQGKVRFEALGPFTDLALFLKKHSALAAEKLTAIDLMAAAFGHGNCGPAFRAEFNVFLDVDGFIDVLEWAKTHGVPVSLTPWDDPVMVWQDQLPHLNPADARAEFLRDCIAAYFDVHGEDDAIPGDTMWDGYRDLGKFWRFSDPKVALYLLHPEMMWRESMEIVVVNDVTRPEHYGRTIDVRDASAELPSGAHWGGPFAVDVIHPKDKELAARKLLALAGLRFT